MQSENLRNLEIALHILRIPRLHSNLKIAQPISRLHNTHIRSAFSKQSSAELFVCMQYRKVRLFWHAIVVFWLENVEHCGGESEQADTGILCH